MTNRRLFCMAGLLLAGFLFVVAAGCRTSPSATHVRKTWRGVHVPVFSDSQLAKLQGELPGLAAVGVNVLVVQVDYHFDFQSHPELRARGELVTRDKARAFTAAAHRLGICVIPELDCLGHQSLAGTTWPLLAKYPQFDETPDRFPGNKGIY